MSLTLLAAAVGLALVACGGSGPRKPTVVVLPVKGKNGDRMSEAIIKVLTKQGEYTLLDPGEYQSTAKQMGAVKVKSRNVRKVAGKIGAEVVVSGRLKRVRKKEYRLTVDIRDGRTGKRVERFKLRLRKRKLNKRARGELEVELVQAMSTVDYQDAPMKADEGDVVAEKGEKKKKKKKKEKKPRAKKKSKKQIRAEREAAEREEREREEREEREAKRAAKEDAKRKKREEREAREEAKREKKRLAAEKKKREAEEKKRKEREAKLAAARAKKKKEAEERRRKKEQADLDKVTKPKTDDSGQVLDDETPGGL